MAKRVENKVVIVTGAGTGIGKSCMQLFAEEGANVVGCGRRIEKLEETLEGISFESNRGFIIPADLSQNNDAQKVVEKAVQEFGKVDILVHAASVGWSWSHQSADSMNDIAETPPEKWHEVMGINLNACYYMCHSVLQHMLKAKCGSIVNVASISGLVGMPNAHTYCSAKGGVINLTRAMATAYGKRGVRANCVCPGYTDTPMISDVMHMFDDQNIADYLTPMSRAGTPEEMAYACLYLGSDEASYCNGVVLPVDGGTVARQ